MGSGRASEGQGEGEVILARLSTLMEAFNDAVTSVAQREMVEDIKKSS